MSCCALKVPLLDSQPGVSLGDTPPPVPFGSAQRRRQELHLVSPETLEWNVPKERVQLAVPENALVHLRHDGDNRVRASKALEESLGFVLD